MISDLTHPADEILDTMQRIYSYRMTTTSGGNISIMEENGDVWITPARVDKGSLQRDDIVCVKRDGSVEGRHPPSSEYPFHKAIYDRRPDIRGIIHAHPVALVAFSISGAVPDTHLFHQARHVCGPVGFAPYKLPGSRRLAGTIADTFLDETFCVIMENHGVVVGGGTLQNAFQRFETLEFTAKTIIKARQIGEVRYLSDEQVELPRDHFRPLPDFDPSPPTSREKELRRQLRDFIRRGYQQRLMISTEGSFSVRLDDHSFLISPYQVDRRQIDLHDIVLVRNGQRERGKFPSRASRNHMAIYNRHPDVGAVVNAYTVNANAFSVTRQALNTRTIPESYVFLRDVQLIPYGVQFKDPEALAQSITEEKPIALLENDGMVVTGGDILATFDRLEVLEYTAEALINGRPLGDISPMDDDVIEELKEAFLS